MISSKRSWTESDFDEMSWHDNHVHGIRILEGEHGAGTLVLDIDYILEWRHGAENQFEFLVAPAELTFKDVTDLRIALDYAGSSAALTPFSIHAIGRESFSYPLGAKAQRWTIPINWPCDGEFSFVATGFFQRLSGQIVVNQQQYLMPEQRLPLPTPSAGR